MARWQGTLALYHNLEIDVNRVVIVTAGSVGRLG